MVRITNYKALPYRFFSRLQLLPPLQAEIFSEYTPKFCCDTRKHRGKGKRNATEAVTKSEIILDMLIESRTEYEKW
jgi:hypothetical protein